MAENGDGRRVEGEELHFKRKVKRKDPSCEGSLETCSIKLIFRESAGQFRVQWNDDQTSHEDNPQLSLSAEAKPR